jgi:hypothetical protein
VNAYFMQKIVLAFVLVGILSLGAVGAGLGAGMLSVSSQSQSETLVPQIYFVEAQDIINKTGLFSPKPLCEHSVIWVMLSLVVVMNLFSPLT